MWASGKSRGASRGSCAPAGARSLPRDGLRRRGRVDNGIGGSSLRGEAATMRRHRGKELRRSDARWGR